MLVSLFDVVLVLGWTIFVVFLGWSAFDLKCFYLSGCHLYGGLLSLPLACLTVDIDDLPLTLILLYVKQLWL